MQDTILQTIQCKRDLGEALRLMREALSSADSQLDSTLTDIEKDYRLMRDFMLRGFKDPQADSVYNNLLRRAWHLRSAMMLAEMVRANSSFAEAKVRSASFTFQNDVVRRELESFVQDIALASLSPDDERERLSRQCYDRHGRQMQAMFAAILVSAQWQDGTRDFMADTLLSPTIDTNDALLLLSAIMLAAMSVFDVNKWMALTSVYERATDQRLRQRALVGWVFALPKSQMPLFPQVQETVARICSSDDNRRELLELQMQIYYCNNADADNAEIQRDIIPTLMKNNQLQVTKSGLVEKDDDPMEDILDPGAADRKMEAMEKTMNRMMDMQKSGSDIYFGGFSQMKRFPFFNELSNWFCPFFAEHPQLRGAAEKLRDSKFLSMALANGPFCESDKYSFAIALASIIDRMPPNVKELLGNGEGLSFSGVNEINPQSAAYIRRAYLQDLYRFFRLNYHRADFPNPFVGEGGKDSALFLADGLVAAHLSADEMAEIDTFLFKRKQYKAIVALAKSNAGSDGLRHKVIVAMAHMRTGEYGDAKKMLLDVVAAEPDNEQALKGLAHMAFASGEHSAAEHYYERLSALRPDNRNYALNLAISQVSSGHVEQGMASLFRLDYERQGDISVRRAIAWGHLAQGDAQSADAVYTEILASDAATAVDCLNAGYAKWFMMRVEEAVALFRRYVDGMDKAKGRQALADEFAAEKKLLADNGVTDTECRIMTDLL